MADGIEIADAIVIARALEDAGASALVPSSGFTSRVPFLMLRGNLPVREMSDNRQSRAERIGLKLFGRFMVPRHPYAPLFQIEGARRIRQAVGIPVVYIGGVESIDHMQTVLDEGFDFLQLGRATIQDPEFVNRLKSGEISCSPCDHCNRCVAAMDAGGVYCVSNESGFMHT